MSDKAWYQIQTIDRSIAVEVEPQPGFLVRDYLMESAQYVVESWPIFIKPDDGQGTDAGIKLKREALQDALIKAREAVQQNDERRYIYLCRYDDDDLTNDANITRRVLLYGGDLSYDGRAHTTPTYRGNYLPGELEFWRARETFNPNEQYTTTLTERAKWRVFDLSSVQSNVGPAGARIDEMQVHIYDSDGANPAEEDILIGIGREGGPNSNYSAFEPGPEFPDSPASESPYNRISDIIGYNTLGQHNQEWHVVDELDAISHLNGRFRIFMACALGLNTVSDVSIKLGPYQGAYSPVGRTILSEGINRTVDFGFAELPHFGAHNGDLANQNKNLGAELDLYLHSGTFTFQRLFFMPAHAFCSISDTAKVHSTTDQSSSDAGLFIRTGPRGNVYAVENRLIDGTHEPYRSRATVADNWKLTNETDILWVFMQHTLDGREEMVVKIKYSPIYFDI